MDRWLLMLPSRKEMMSYWFEHPIAGSLIAFGMVEGIKTVWESLVNPKGSSPFSTYSDVRSGYILDELGHGGQAANLVEAELHHAQHYNHHKPAVSLGSTSTTTSTSSAHGGTEKVPTGSTWDKHNFTGERPIMFGGPKHKGSVLMGPPSMRRRISLNSITLGGLTKAPQELGKEEEALPTSEHFGLLGMMPEQSDDATDNPWV
jgi:hypothetical protein